MTNQNLDLCTGQAEAQLSTLAKVGYISVGPPPRVTLATQVSGGGNAPVTGEDLIIPAPVTEEVEEDLGELPFAVLAAQTRIAWP